jgi:hypothetical protein
MRLRAIMLRNGDRRNRQSDSRPGRLANPDESARPRNAKMGLPEQAHLAFPDVASS